MTLRLTEDEQAALRKRAEAEGISMQRRRAGRCVSTSPAAATATGFPLQHGGSCTCTPTLSDVSVSDAEVEYLDVEDLGELARLLLGDPPPIRDMGLLGSAAPAHRRRCSATTPALRRKHATR